MKIIHAIIAIAIAALFTATFSFAHGEGDGTDEKSIKLFVMDGSEGFEIDGEDLEVGESKQIFGEGGQEIVVSREEAGYTVSVDGEEIQIGGEHHMSGLLHGEHGAHSKILVKHLGGGDDEVRIIDADGEMDVVIGQDIEWHADKGGHKVMVMDAGDFKSPAQKLQDSGVLDQVDENTREEILEVLRQTTSHHQEIAQRIFIEKHEDGDEENHEH